MPALHTTIEYLQKLALYEHEKPYVRLLSPDTIPDQVPLNNLEFEYRNVVIEDIRELDVRPKVDVCGFEVLEHESQFLKFDHKDDVARYVSETEEMLKAVMGGVYVKCYNTVLRQNIDHKRSQVDLNDPLLREGPARGAHNDVTQDSGPNMIIRYLPADVCAEYLKPGYRFRIVNTWRTLIPVLEDRPLALCDARSVDPEDDLIAADRVLPTRVGEVYYMTYSPDHRWFWLEKQTPKEPFLFVMYDTKGGDHARFCPHISFANPRASESAAPRESIETRSVVITKV